MLPYTAISKRGPWYAGNHKTVSRPLFHWRESPQAVTFSKDLCLSTSQQKVTWFLNAQFQNDQDEELKMLQLEEIWKPSSSKLFIFQKTWQENPDIGKGEVSSELSSRTGLVWWCSDENPPASAEDSRAAGLTPGWGRSLGGGNGSPLQNSCLENSTDRGARWATVHGVSRVRCDWAHST